MNDFLKKLFILILASSFLLSLVAAAQQTSGAAPTAVALARCAYASDSTCPMVNFPSAEDTQTHTPRQFPRPSLGPAMAPPPIPRGSCVTAHHSNGRRALIGAIIGFGLGAAFGAKVNTDQTPGTETKAVLLFGTLGGLLGAGIGASTPSLPPHRPSRNRCPDEEGSALRSEPKSTSSASETSPAEPKSTAEIPSPRTAP